MSTHSIDVGALIASSYDRVVAVEPLNNGTALLYRRTASGAVEDLTVPFEPWLLVSGESLAKAIPDHSRIVALSGSEIHNMRVHFPDLDTYFAGVSWLKQETGVNPSAPLGPYRVFSDLSQQALVMLPARLFRGLDFGDIVRLQIDIETLTSEGYDFPNAEREGDEIIIVSMRDSTGWERCLSGPEMSEKEILETMVRLVRERDPDVIEGHNIFNFDLPYIAQRCKRHRVRLALGRDGSRVKARSSRFTAGERTATYTRYDIHGRHVVDTLQLVQLYDVSHRDLESYGLKAVAQYFHVAAPDRTYVEGSEISNVYRRDPDLLRAYAMDDVRETDAIGALLAPSYFYQAQLVPFSYQNCVTRGNATRIDAILTGEYMREDASLPCPQAPRPFQGGLTESLEEGVFQTVWHVDVRSLYPSIIISREMTPRADHLGVYLKLLTELRRFRLEAKDAVRTAAPDQRDHYDALQSTFKILINSFYGYTGFAQGTFNDYDLAEAVTAEGRRILQSMLDVLQREGASVIEMDTDGIYFVPPDTVSGTDEMEARIQDILPDGIEVDLDSTYRAMLGYKSKNYALLAEDGSVAITGAALKSRGLEPFQRNFIRDLIELLLNGRGAEAPDLLNRYRHAVETHTLALADLAKREVLSTPPRVYREKLEAGKTRRSAAYELVLKCDREYKQGDTVVFYVTGDKKNVSVTDNARLLSDAHPDVRDENVPYYLEKLNKLAKKFDQFIES